MTELETEKELGQWLSTYGTITAERILGKYQIGLPHDELMITLKSPFSLYHRLLQVPLKNILNGIVFQQANDYHLYAQKLFIDYLLSGESSKGENEQGDLTREALNDEQRQLVLLGEEYHQKKSDHDVLIATSQKALIEFSKKWQLVLDSKIKEVNASLISHGFDVKKSTIKQAIHHAMVHCDLTQLTALKNKYTLIDSMNEIFHLPLTAAMKEALMSLFSELPVISLEFDSLMHEFLQQTKALGSQAQSFREQFYNTILRVTHLIQLLPDYKINPEQDEINREALYFDSSIGLDKLT